MAQLSTNIAKFFCGDRRHPALDGLTFEPTANGKDKKEENGSWCFFATNVCDLLLLLSSSSSSASSPQPGGLYVFRVHLPNDEIPPSTQATCCRYSYTVIDSAKLRSRQVSVCGVLWCGVVFLKSPYFDNNCLFGFNTIRIYR